MKIRIFPGHLNSYVQKGGSWDEKTPDPASFEVDVVTAPIKGHYLIYHLPDTGGSFIGLIDDVIMNGEFTYVFISASKLA
jgi:hypothetical protein